MIPRISSATWKDIGIGKERMSAAAPPEEDAVLGVRPIDENERSRILRSPDRRRRRWRLVRSLQTEPLFWSKSSGSSLWPPKPCIFKAHCRPMTPPLIGWIESKAVITVTGAQMARLAQTGRG